MFPTNACFKRYNKIDRSSCLFERNDGPNLPFQQFFSRAPFHVTFFDS